MASSSVSIDDRLLDYLDGTLPPGERQALEARIQTDAAVAARLETLRLMHALMSGQRTEAPSANFTARVMGGLDKRAATVFSIRQGILVVTGILTVIGIAAALVGAGVFDPVLATIDLNQVKPKGMRYFDESPLPSFVVNGKFIVNGIILLNLALAFVVLDRAVLRPFFQRRLHAGH